MDSINVAVSSQAKAYAYLKEQISSLRFRPNQRIKALEIADQLGISRTPVKEALSRLEQEGLVKRDLGSGYVVEAITGKQILDLYRVREALEVEAAREALPVMNNDILAALGKMLENSEPLLREERYDEFLRASRNFHNEIAAVTGNEVLRQMLAKLNDRIWSIGTIVVKKYPARAHEILLDNRRLLEALRSRDLSAVEHAVRLHIGGAGETVRKFMVTELHHLYFAAA